METEVVDVAGVRLHKVIGESSRELLAAVRALAGTDKFPGPLPVSLERANFPTLQKGTYWLCEKTDGTRFILSCVRHKGLDVCCLIDRSFSLFLLPLRHIPTAMFQGSLLDGELAKDKVTGRAHFVIFDALDVSGIPVHTYPLSRRLAYLKIALGAYSAVAEDPAILEIKRFVPACMAATYAPTARFDVDGLVLTPEDEPIQFGRHNRLFKLKTHHTIDFEVDGSGTGLLVFDPKTRTKARVATLEEVEDRVGTPTPGSIVECDFVRPGVWRIVLVRSDKTRSNDMLTYTKTMLNIEEAISVDEVVRVFTAL